jgi:hypothetical protein
VSWISWLSIGKRVYQGEKKGRKQTFIRRPFKRKENGRKLGKVT